MKTKTKAEKPMERIQRMYEFEIRAENNEENGNYITGCPIVYGKKTDLGYFDEIIEPGALDKCNLKDVRFLVNHNIDMIPLARSRNNNKNSTMQLMVDKNGMEIRVNLDTENNAEAKSLYSAVKRGDLSGMSFMFIIGEEEWENLNSDHPTRHIKSITDVFEVSAVTFPAYEDTEITARDKKALESARIALDSARRSLDSETSEKMLEIEKEKNRNRTI